MTEVIVYQAPSGPPPVSRPKTAPVQPPPPPAGGPVRPTAFRRRSRQLFRWVGNLLLFSATLSLVLFYWPLLVVESRYLAGKRIGSSTPSLGFGELINLTMPRPILAAPDPNFSLVIPKIDAQAKILANVDAGSSREYRRALSQGVAHAKGTVFPNMKGTIYLFAHSTDSPWNIVRHNAVFYLLRELEPGDEVVVFFRGIRFNYRVVKKEIVEPSETGFFSQKEKEQLVLQTCHPPGTTRQSLLVFAEREV